MQQEALCERAQCEWDVAQGGTLVGSQEEQIDVGV
jgi:hypothetical protein